MKGLARFCALCRNLRLHKSESSLSVQTMQFLLSRANDGIKRCPEKEKKLFPSPHPDLGAQRGAELDQ